MECQALLQCLIMDDSKITGDNWKFVMLISSIIVCFTIVRMPIFDN